MNTGIKHPEYFFWTALVASLFLVFGPPSRAIPPQEVAAESKENPFDAVELSAKAAYIYDVRARRALFEKDADAVLPLASIAKIMTAATALLFVPETTYVTIDDHAIREEGDSGFAVGERWLLRDLLALTLLESSNDGAAAVSGTIGGILATTTTSVAENRMLFVGEMNRLAQDIGLTATYFFNESGLDLGESDAGAYSTAAETARMLAYALGKFPSVFRETRWSELVLGAENGNAHPAKNTNKGVRDLPLLIASKTGYTDLAGGNLVIAFDAGFNRPVIVVVLGSTPDGRFTDVEKLVWTTLEYLSQNM